MVAMAVRNKNIVRMKINSIKSSNGVARKKRIDKDFVGVGFDVETRMPEPLNFGCHAPEYLN